MLKQRIITACVLLLVLVLVLFVLPFNGFLEAISLLLVIAAWEWANMAGLCKPWQRFTYAGIFAVLFFVLMHIELQQWTSTITGILFFSVCGWLLALFAIWRYPVNKGWQQTWLLLLIGLWLLVPAWLGLQLLQPAMARSGLIWLVIAIIAAADIGAYFSGKRFGRHKLAVHVSPGKTREGFWGGMLASAALAGVIATVMNLHALQFLFFVMAMALVAAASVLGDLFESMVKRERGLKDSSQLLPGHGGVLDRIDGWTAAVPLFALLYLLFGR